MEYWGIFGYFWMSYNLPLKIYNQCIKPSECFIIHISINPSLRTLRKDKILHIRSLRHWSDARIECQSSSGYDARMIPDPASLLQIVEQGYGTLRFRRKDFLGPESDS